MSMKIESNAFQNGSEIPRKYGYKKDNVNPTLVIQDVPMDAKSLALIMDDPDAMGAVGKSMGSLGCLEHRSQKLVKLKKIPRLPILFKEKQILEKLLMGDQPHQTKNIRMFSNCMH